MPADHIPRKPTGHVPGKEFVDTGAPYGLKLGIITRVDEISQKADIKVLTGGGERFEIDLTQGMQGPRSFWGGMPEVNSIAIIGYRRKHKQLHEAVILGYIPVSGRLGMRFDPFAPSDPSAVDPADRDTYSKIFGGSFRAKRMKLRPGDVGGMSASGSEFTLTKDVRMANRAGDLFELRETDRTWVGQSIHRVESESGVLRISGPIRRGAFFTYPDILRADGVTLKDSPDPERYFGRTVYQSAGPGFAAGGPNKYADSTGKLLTSFNNTNEFPPVTYSNGRRVFYPATQPGVSLEDSQNGAGAYAFTEWRQEIAHTSDLSQDVREEIDGFQISRPRAYIESVLGTLVGNDSSSSAGQRVYGRVLKPKLFDDFTASGPGKFSLEDVSRDPTDDQEIFTTAGAALLAVHPVRSIDDNYFAASVSKQGKLFLNVPGSIFERYPSGTKNVSAEVMLQGALKAFIGASNPDNVSIQLTCAGGISADIGSNSSGRAIDVRYHSSVSASYMGVPDVDDLAYSENIQGVKQSFTSGDNVQNVGGAKATTVNGGYTISTDRLAIAAHSGMGVSAGDWSSTISGKSQYTYALAVLETIFAGGKISTILAGACINTIAAGAYTINVLAGATTINSAAGAYTVSVGAGGIAMSAAAGAVSIAAAAGAISLAAAAGAISLTAGLALALTSPVVISLISTQILLGGPPAVFGVSRGLPMMPPGVPSLDWITGLPLMGCALVRSI